MTDLDLDLIDEDPCPEAEKADLLEAYLDGRADGLAMAAEAVQALERKCSGGATVNLGELQKLRKAFECI